MKLTHKKLFFAMALTLLGWAQAAQAQSTFAAIQPRIALDTNRNRYLVTFERAYPFNGSQPATRYEILGRFVNANGQPLGASFLVAPVINTIFNPNAPLRGTTAYDPVDDKFLTVWDQVDQALPTLELKVFGKLIRGDNGEMGSTTIISALGSRRRHLPMLTYNPDQKKWLTILTDGLANQGPNPNEKIMRGIINNDLTGFTASLDLISPFPTSALGFFPVFNRYFTRFDGTPSYIFAFQGRDSATTVRTYLTIRRASDFSVVAPLQDLLSAETQTTFTPYLSSEGYDHFTFNMNPNGSRFLYARVAQETNPNTSYKINFNVLKEDFQPIGTGSSIGTGAELPTGLASAFDIEHNRFLVVWHERNGTVGGGTTDNYNILGQFIDASSGTVSGAAFNIAASGDSNEFSPDVIYNPVCKNFMVAYSGAEEIRFARVGPECPGLTLSEPSLNFGTVILGGRAQKTLTLTNSNASVIPVLRVAHADSLTLPYRILEDGCTGQNLAQNQSCNITAEFAPNAAGKFDERFEISLESTSFIPLLIDVTGISQDWPLKPTLVFPDNGATDIDRDPTFKWRDSFDPNRSQVNYELTYCTAQDFKGCAAVPVSRIVLTRQLAGFAGASALLIALVILGTLLRSPTQRRALFLLIAVTAGGIFYSCSSGTDETRNSFLQRELIFSVDNLEPGTKYFWKVTARSAEGNTAESDTWSFTTR